MAEIKIDVDVVCDCGNTLNATYHRGELVVDPCDDCMQRAQEDVPDNYDAGFEEGAASRDDDVIQLESRVAELEQSLEEVSETYP
jgi:exonuclease VII small subunit